MFKIMLVSKVLKVYIFSQILIVYTSSYLVPWSCFTWFLLQTYTFKKNCFSSMACLLHCLLRNEIVML